MSALNASSCTDCMHTIEGMDWDSMFSTSTSVRKGTVCQSSSAGWFSTFSVDFRVTVEPLYSGHPNQRRCPHFRGSSVHFSM